MICAFIEEKLVGQLVFSGGHRPDFDISDFTQEVPGQPRENWQAAYDEYYLCEQGDVIIGDFLHAPKNDGEACRLAFFMYFLDFDTPLITPYGKLKLPNPTSIERLMVCIQGSAVHGAV